MEIFSVCSPAVLFRASLTGSLYSLRAHAERSRRRRSPADTSKLPGSANARCERPGVVGASAGCADGPPPPSFLRPSGTPAPGAAPRHAQGRRERRRCHAPAQVAGAPVRVGRRGQPHVVHAYFCHGVHAGQQQVYRAVVQLRGADVEGALEHPRLLGGPSQLQLVVPACRIALQARQHAGTPCARPRPHAFL